jgi:hypothetical protein
VHLEEPVNQPLTDVQFRAPEVIEASIRTPPGWTEVRARVGGRAFKSHTGLAAIVSVDEIMRKRWLHVSISRASRTPTYDDLAWAKEGFIGPDLPAYQVFPRSAEHRNLHPNCLHLWAPLDGDPFPDELGERAESVAPAGVTLVRP